MKQSEEDSNEIKAMEMEIEKKPVERTDTNYSLRL